jgi:putative phosphoribosyl transferase
LEAQLFFADREDAARRLVEKLPEIDAGNTVVLALPRGGVPMGGVIAKALDLPLDVALVRKIGAPGHRELAVGAVSNGEAMQVTVNHDVAAMLGLTDEDVARLGKNELPELKRRRKLYGGDRPPVPISGMAVIVVDDGIATGATMRAALRLIRKQGAKKIILAVPVAPVEVISEMEQEADIVVCLSTPSNFYAVGAYYANFNQIADDEVIATLSDLHREKKK